MRPLRIGLIALLTLLATVAINHFQVIQNPKSRIPNSQVLAQTPDARKAEADRLLQQGIAEFSQLPSSSFAFDRVIPPMEVALKLYREIKDQRGEMNVLVNLGIAYEAFGHSAEAIDYYQQGLTIAREIKDRKVETDILNNLGYVYTVGYIRDYRQAIDYEQQGLTIAREIKYRMGEVDALNRLGIVYTAKKNYQQAIDYYQQSLAITRELKDQKGEVMVLGNLELAYKDQGNYQQAKYYEEQRLAIGRETKERQIAAKFSLEVQHCRKTGDRYCEMIALWSAGANYGRLDNYLKAIEHLQQALAIAREIGDRPQQEHYLIMLSEDYSRMNDYPKAIEILQIALAISREITDTTSESRILNGLSEAYRALGKDATADDYSRLGSWFSPINFRGLPNSRKINSLTSGALYLFEHGRVAEAEKKLLDAIQSDESLARKTPSGEYNELPYYYGNYYMMKIYYTLQQILIDQNKIQIALEVSERGRARALMELLAKRNAITNDSGKSTITPPTIGLLQQIAKQHKSTLVEYSIITDKSKDSRESEFYIWVIKATGEVTFRKVDLKPLWQQQNTTLADLVTTSRDSIGVRDLPIIGIVPRPSFQQRQEASLTEQLQQLHKLLIEPIADLLPTDPNAHVVFMPQGSLFLVPFAALQDKDGKYLIEKHTILTAPSIQVLGLTYKQRQKRGNGEALVVGNPTMPSIRPAPDQPPQPLPSLPDAETEANAIAPLLHTKPLIGNQATKSAVVQLLPKARIIHLATHGLLDDVRGLGSAIALAPDSSHKEEVGKVNGLLTAEEILDMKLNAELVVLSACNTGRGRITGDGIIGLSRSLISAGVPSVLVSLWSVPDAPTAQLMTEFYQNLQKNPDKAQALRQAMLTILKQYPNAPKNWAAFTLIGESN